MDRLLEFVNAHYWLATGTALAVALIVVYEMRARAESQFAVSPQELIRLMNQGALLLDLRPPDQYQAGHLAGARQMNGEALLTAGDTLKRHKEKTVVVYDDTGSVSAAAVPARGPGLHPHLHAARGTRRLACGQPAAVAGLKVCVP